VRDHRVSVEASRTLLRALVICDLDALASSS
jgi:hypothetical protein